VREAPVSDRLSYHLTAFAYVVVCVGIAVAYALTLEPLP
jgi:hypothetical protein